MLEQSNAYNNVSYSPFTFAGTTNNAYSNEYAYVSTRETSVSSTGGGEQEELPVLPWDDPRNLISRDAYTTISFVCHFVLIPASFLIGMPTNILSCFVFYKQGLADRMNLCLFVLALVDAAFLVSTIASILVQVLAWQPVAWVIVNFIFFVWAMRSASACITTLVAVERCVCVVFPLRAKSIMTTRTMGALLATIVITMTLGNSILCFMHKVEESYDEATGHTSYHVVYADFTDKYPVIFYLVYDLIYNVIICLITPTLTFVVVAVATSITVIKLKMAIAWRASTSSGRGDDQSQLHQVALTKTLVIVSSIFVALSVPRTVLTIVRLSVASFAIDGYNSNLYSSVVVMSNSLMLSNSSVNFFVYYRSAKFRQELCALCSCRKDQGRATSGN